MAKLTSKQHLLADLQNVLAKHERFEKFGGGETSKQGQDVEIVSCQANNVDQFRQAFTHVIKIVSQDLFFSL